MSETKPLQKHQVEDHAGREAFVFLSADKLRQYR